jgi:hypothetical protein
LLFLFIIPTFPLLIFFSVFYYAVFFYWHNVLQHYSSSLILSPPLPLSRQTVPHLPLLHTHTHIYSVWISCMGETMWYLSFWTWLLSLNRIISNSIHFPANDVIHFSLFIHCVYTTFSLSIHLVLFFLVHITWFLPDL